MNVIAMENNISVQLVQGLRVKKLILTLSILIVLAIVLFVFFIQPPGADRTIGAGSGVLESTIIQNSDDGTEVNGQEWLESGIDNVDMAGRTSEGNEYCSGFRFRLDELNQGEEIQYARLKFASKGGEINSGARLLIEGVLQASPTTFNQEDRPSQKLPKTNTQIEWNIDESWINEFIDSENTPVYYYSADIAPIINEIIGLANWGEGSEGKTLIVTVKDNGSRADETNNILFKDLYYRGLIDIQVPVTLEVYRSVSDTFLGQEMLGKPTDNSISININSLLDLNVYIEYGMESGVYPYSTEPLLNQSAGSTEIRIEGLSANTKHYYRLVYRRVGTEEYSCGEEYSFRTQRQMGSTFKFDITADEHYPYTLTADENRLALYKQTIANIKNSQPDFLISLGDFALTDWVEGREVLNLVEARQRYLNQRSVLNEISNSTSFYLALGNHEGEVGWEYDFDNPGENLDSLAVLSAQARKDLILNPYPDEFYSGNNNTIQELGSVGDYYSWQWGDALFVVLDPYWYTEDQPRTVGDNWAWTLGEEQYNWLYETLHNSNAKWKFIFLHHLLSSNTLTPYNHYYGRGGIEIAKYKVAGMASFEWGGEDEAGNYVFNELRPGWNHGSIHDMLVAEDVDIVFHGHDHLFATQELDGIIYQECPQPSDPDYTYGFLERGGYENGNIYPNSGHLEVTVSSNTVTVSYIRSFLPGDGNNGEISHTYTLRRNQPVPPIKQRRYNQL